MPFTGLELVSPLSNADDWSGVMPGVRHGFRNPITLATVGGTGLGMFRGSLLVPLLSGSSLQ